MRKIDTLLHEYGVSHQNSTNKLIHWFCVPLIFFSIVGLFFSIPVGPLHALFPFLGSFANWATISLLLVIIYYLGLSLSLAVGMLFFSVFCLAIANFLNLVFPGMLWIISLGVFIAAWIVQFIGHEIEGKKPSFLKDVQFLMIGPAWLMHFIYKQIGLRY